MAGTPKHDANTDSNMPPRRLSSLALSIAAVCTIAASPAAAADAMFIGEFVAKGNEWPDLVGRSLTIEGRVSSFAGTVMRFEGSKLRVRLPDGTRRPAFTDRIEVSGVLKSDRGLPMLEAYRVTPLPKTADWIKQLRVQVKADDATQWYAFADEIRRRAAFYDDDALQAAAADFDLRGFRAEAAAAGTDPVRLRAVAARGKERNIPIAERAVLLHEAAWQQWRLLEPGLDPERGGVAVSDTLVEAAALRDRVREELPGADRPLPPGAIADDLRQTYLRLPDRTYVEADPERRPALHRLLLIELARAIAGAEFAVAPGRGDAIADRLAAAIPDRPEMVAAFRSQAADAMLDRIGTLSEQEAVSLSERLTESRSPEDGRAALVAWLEARRPAAALDGAAAMTKLAEDTERLTGDIEAAAEVAIAALRTDSRHAGAIGWLKSHGYEQVGGAWRLSDERPTGASESALMRLAIGQTVEQARTVLGVLPDRTLRMVSRGTVSEFWTYDDLGLVLTVERRGEISRVVDIVRETPAVAEPEDAAP